MNKKSNCLFFCRKREYQTPAFKKYVARFKFSHSLLVRIPFDSCFPPLNKYMVANFKMLEANVFVFRWIYLRDMGLASG